VQQLVASQAGPQGFGEGIGGSIIVPHYLGDVVSDCLRSIFESTGRGTPIKVIVVDDQPRDDGSIARARAAFPEIIVTKTHGRHGFGAACNAGLAVARGKYVAILNNDTVVSPGWLAPLIEAAEADPSVGVLQSKTRLEVCDLGVDVDVVLPRPETIRPWPRDIDRYVGRHG
jgi:GT2 family glycosyltransferase